MNLLLQRSEIERDGFAIIENVLSERDVADWNQKLGQLFATDTAAIKSRQGAVYAARNILSSLPACCDVASLPMLSQLLTETLGPGFGLVRGLYFDKHPDRTWSLPWHKDVTIAVKDNSIETTQFCKPTKKSGVPHVEAPESVLENMLTLRFHLDEVTEENGPVEVAVGSHANGKRPDASHEARKILVSAGDVLAMRPLISHTSASSDPNTRRHRRILHLEYSGDRELPDGYEWFQFLQS